jgi:hypothetical protein
MNLRQYGHLALPSAIGVGAGLSAALLYGLASQGTLIAGALACLAPLPIMIGMLGFGRLVGAIALAAACIAVALLLPGMERQVETASGFDSAGRAALGFAIMLGMPALWLSYLASMSRLPGQSQWQATATPSSTPFREYASVERIVTAAVAIAATVVVLGVLVLVLRHGSLDQAVDRIATEIAPMIEEMLASKPPLPAGYDSSKVARMIVVASPPVAGGMLFLVLILNLWLAAKVARLSGRLPRPWPDVAKELVVPRPYGLLLGAAFATTFLGGPAAVIASVVAMVLAAAFALQGLAVVHVVSRGWQARSLVLWIMYGAFLAFMPSGIPLLLCTLLGLVESLHSFRSRRAATPPKI